MPAKAADAVPMLGAEADRGPSVALCGKMPRGSGGPRAICGLVRKDAWAEAADRGPSVASGRSAPQATRDEMRPRVWWAASSARALDLSARVVRRESCELVNLRERCATRCTQQERPNRPRATKCRGRPRTAHASLRAAGAPAHRRAESSTARPVTRPRRGRPAPAG
jgi:hypothetical protein